MCYNNYFCCQNQAPWNRFTGYLSGLWASDNDADRDVYVMAHNATDNALNVWWDTAVISSIWTTGRGALASDNVTVNMTGFPEDLVGKVSKDGETIGMPYGWRRKKYNFFTKPIRSVHVVFMNHLDIGYTNFINPVYDEYIHTYYQRAINISQGMRDMGGTDRYLYGTHPMLMDLLLDCPPHMDLGNPFTQPLQCPTEARAWS